MATNAESYRTHNFVNMSHIVILPSLINFLQGLGADDAELLQHYAADV